MNQAHLHLMLCHLPLIGMTIGAVVLAFAMLRKSEELTRAGLSILVLSAVFIIPTFLTGEGAEEMTEHLPDVSAALIGKHEDVSKWALIITGLSGLVAATKLFFYRGANWLVPTSLGLAFLAAGIIGYTANLGGQIRHTEIRAASSPVTTDKKMTAPSQEKTEHNDIHKD